LYWTSAGVELDSYSQKQSVKKITRNFSKCQTYKLEGDDNIDAAADGG